MFIYLGFKVLKPPLQLLDGLTQEAISSLQLPTTLEQPAKVSRCRLWTEVGLTLLRACPIFFVTSCFYALRFGFAVLGLRALCEQKTSTICQIRCKVTKQVSNYFGLILKKCKKTAFFMEIGRFQDENHPNPE